LKTSIKTITYLSDIGCLEIQGASLLIQNYRRRGYQFQKGLSPDFRHWIISVRLPYSERPPRPSRTYQQRIWR
ncbi:hypothetical protein FVB16_10665, partial [Escherichia coli]|nr:hypothetical protein [Escherichia coli]